MSPKEIRNWMNIYCYDEIIIITTFFFSCVFTNRFFSYAPHMISINSFSFRSQNEMANFIAAGATHWEDSPWNFFFFFIKNESFFFGFCHYSVCGCCHFLHRDLICTLDCLNNTTGRRSGDRSEIDFYWNWGKSTCVFCLSYSINILSFFFFFIFSEKAYRFIRFWKEEEKRRKKRHSSVVLDVQLIWKAHFHFVKSKCMAFLFIM